jgi:hypothetical protein
MISGRNTGHASNHPLNAATSKGANIEALLIPRLLASTEKIPDTLSELGIFMLLRATEMILVQNLYFCTQSGLNTGARYVGFAVAPRAGGAGVTIGVLIASHLRGPFADDGSWQATGSPPGTAPAA